nr:putative ribonuclease H-like domain-containing protein [Tanacetum cinerariifolium]
MDTNQQVQNDDDEKDKEQVSDYSKKEVEPSAKDLFSYSDLFGLDPLINKTRTKEVVEKCSVTPEYLPGYSPIPIGKPSVLVVQWENRELPRCHWIGFWDMIRFWNVVEELEKLKRQETEADDAAETLRKKFAQSTEDLLLQVGATRASDTNYIPSLEDIYEVSSDGIFTSASYDDEGAVADFINLESTMNVSLIPQSRIHSIHPTTQIFRDPNSAVQTRNKVNKSSRAYAFEELLQFKTQKVWILVYLPFGKKVIGTKWVYRNKKDEQGVVVRNKARLVAQGHRQEERIDYDEVFAYMARIEAIRIFLAFASNMGFIVC